jgi:hypothetical protein
LIGGIMDYIFYIIVVLVVIYVFVKVIIMPRVKKKKTIELLSKYEAKGFKLTIGNKNSYDYILENDKRALFIKVVTVPTNSQITINNVSTWKLSWGGDPSKLGRSYPNSSYMAEVSDFIKVKYEEDKEIIKLILIYPHTEKILRYINESELEIITPDKTPYGYKVSNFKNFDQDFDTIINIKTR